MLLCTICMSSIYLRLCFSFFFFNDTATTEIYTLSLHDALPIYSPQARGRCERLFGTWQGRLPQEFRLRSITTVENANERSEEHTSELQSRLHLVCRLLLEKKKKTMHE